MGYKKFMLVINRIPTLLASALLIGLVGCNSDDDETDGYIQFYNASPNAPKLFLIVDKNDDDDYDEVIHTGVSYAQSTGYLEYEVDAYDIEIAWQDDDDTNNLETIYTDQLQVTEDNIQFVVINEDISNPNVLIFDTPVIDDDDDLDDDLFNIRFLNMHSWSAGIDIYLSKSNETFNEAMLIGQYNYSEISQNIKFEQDDYIFYITSAGSSDILYQSDEISYPSTAQYVMVIRQNIGSGSSPFILDKVSSSSRVVEYPDADAEGKFRVYNGITHHQLLPSYQGVFDLHLDGIDTSAEISSLALGEFSHSFLTSFGDYSMSLTLEASDQTLVDNHLLTLDINSDKSVFFYLLEEDVDEDGDGDVDENGDGYVDEIEVTINSLIVNNNPYESIYDHQVNVINLVDEFKSLDVYFVRSDETIETADYSTKAYYTTPHAITLRNNTYSVYVIAEEDSSELILATFELTLDETSQDLFLILEEDVDSATGYKMSFQNQKI